MRYTITFLLASHLCSAAGAEVPKVVTDFGPVQSLVLQVMGDLGTPVVLLPKGGDPHDFQMKPSQATALAGADLLFWDGPDLMPALASAVAAQDGHLKSIPLLHQGGGRLRQFEGGGVDPHAWLDPTNGVAWLGTIAAELAALDPDNAATYAANAASAQSALRDLDADLAARLAPVKDKPFVVFHDAIGYFADHYGLTVAGAIELGDASTPGAAQLVSIRDLLARSGAVCVFPETGRDPAYIATVSEGSTVRIGAGQDVEGLNLDQGPGQYAALLTGLAETLTECLSAD